MSASPSDLWTPRESIFRILAIANWARVNLSVSRLDALQIGVEGFLSQHDYDVNAARYSPIFHRQSSEISDFEPDRHYTFNYFQKILRGLQIQKLAKIRWQMTLAKSHRMHADNCILEGHICRPRSHVHGRFESRFRKSAQWRDGSFELRNGHLRQGPTHGRIPNDPLEFTRHIRVVIETYNGNPYKWANMRMVYIFKA